MKSKKIKNLKELGEMSKKLRAEGKKVGLITGCFDILHVGHLNLFMLAKKKVDVLIVGVDNDESIGLTKGDSRPINKLRDRVNLLSSIEFVDYVFVMRAIFLFGSAKASQVHEKYTQKIAPYYLITTPSVDEYWKNKAKLADDNSCKLLKINHKRKNSSTKVAKMLSKEF